MWSQPENQKAVTVQLYEPVSVVREMRWYFWKCNQSLTRGAWFTKCMLFIKQPLDSADTLSEGSEAD